MNNDFRKYATKHLGINGLVLDEVMSAQAQYLNPYILEERQLNVTQMDVFSRLMMDRIIFLGTQIDDYTANTLQAQLLYLDSVDSGKDITSMTPCSSSPAMSLPSVRAWLPQWLPCCWWLVRRASARLCRIAV